MKRFVFLILLAFLCQSAFGVGQALADDVDFWDDAMKVDQEAKSQQKAVTDEEFEKVLKLFKKKKKDPKKPKGNPIGPQVPEDQTQPDANAFKQTYESYPTVMIPVTLVTDTGIEIQPGYYRILSVKNEDKKEYFLNFYQGSSIIAKIKAYETDNDHNQESLNYTKVMPVNEDVMSIIYGDIDCNLESHLQIKQ